MAGEAWPEATDSNQLTRKENVMMQRTIQVLTLVVLVAAMAGAADNPSSSGVVNINTADAEQLQLLPRVGPALAGRIIEFREVNGPYQNVDEILAVKGIGESSFKKLEPYIVTSGATTLADKVKLARSTGGAKAAD